jgi:hypothetical protein
MDSKILNITDLNLSDEDISVAFIEHLFVEEFDETYLDNEESFDWDDLYLTVINNGTTVCEVGLRDDEVGVAFFTEEIFFQKSETDKDIIVDQLINISEEY